MSLDHEFVLIPKDMAEQCSDFDYSLTQRSDIEKAILHDDVLGYISDSLKWIPTQNPCMQERTSGLHWYGITLIGDEGAPIMKRVLRAWLDLFRNGPETLLLTGGYCWIYGESPEKGHYEIIELEREMLLGNLNRICMMCEKVLTEGSVIVHFGI